MDKYIRYPCSNEFENPVYDQIYKQSIDNKEEFWAEEAKELVWTKFPQQILKKGDLDSQYRWYADGEMNICYNCIDRHVDQGKGGLEALVYYSTYTETEFFYTYRDL